MFSSNQLISSQNAFIAANGNVVLGTSAFVGGIQANNTGGKVCDVGVTTAITTSAVFEIVSTTKGFLPPRMDSTQRNAIVSPAQGLTIYNTTSKAFEVFNGAAWYSTVHYIGESYGGGIVFIYMIMGNTV